jgi:DNA repair photolyase
MMISISNSSDPYPPLESKLKLTRRCLEVFARGACRLQIITKSDLVVRDIDLLKQMPSVVSFTVTTLREDLAKKLEPNAPSPEKRLLAMRELSEGGIPVTLRFDPVIPSLNEAEMDDVAKAAASSGAMHVTASTFKPRWDSWKRMEGAFPEAMLRLKPLYFKDGIRHQNSWYLPREIRLELMLRVREACRKHGLTFASCREGFPKLTTAKTCDGSHLMPAV